MRRPAIAPGRYVTAAYPPAMSAVTRRKTTMATNTSLHLDHAGEHVGGQIDAGAAQPLPAFGAHSGGAETAHDLSFRVQAGLLEHEDLLHRDDVPFHPGDLG